jgi:hypothetical protein
MLNVEWASSGCAGHEMKFYTEGCTAEGTEEQVQKRKTLRGEESRRNVKKAEMLSTSLQDPVRLVYLIVTRGILSKRHANYRVAKNCVGTSKLVLCSVKGRQQHHATSILFQKQQLSGVHVYMLKCNHWRICSLGSLRMLL